MPICSIESDSQQMVVTVVPRGHPVTARILVAIPAVPQLESAYGTALKRLAALGAEISACVGDDSSPGFSTVVLKLAQRKSDAASIFVGFGSAARLAPQIAAQTNLRATVALLVEKPFTVAEIEHPPKIPSLIVFAGQPLSSDVRSNAGRPARDPVTHSIVFIEETDRETATTNAIDACEKWLVEQMPGLRPGP